MTDPTIPAEKERLASRAVRIADLEQLRQRLAEAPSLLLSASVPYLRKPSDFVQSERAERRRRNKIYVDSARPERIRAAVVSLALAAVTRKFRLVFGAHPAISPMILTAARDAGAPPESIIIFQSEFYLGRLPSATLELASWDAGLLVITKAAPERPTATRSPASLTLMRELMVGVPGLTGAVFVGGMEGVEEEAALFNLAHHDLPRYAVASSGSAAAELLKSEPARFKGTSLDEKMLTSSPSYSVVAGKIFEDLNYPPGSGGAKRI